MKDDNGMTSKALRESTLLYGDGRTTITHDMTCVSELRAIDALMRDIAKRGSLVFYRGMVRGQMLPIASPLAKRLMSALTYSTDAIRRAYPQGRFSPYFELFERIVAPHKQHLQVLDATTFASWDGLVERIKAAMRVPEFREKRRAHERNIRKNYASLVRYLRDLHTFNSKLLAVRVDVGYKVEFTKGVSFEQFRKHIDELLEYVRKSANGAHVGHVWKLEHGDSRGYHAHLLILYNGQKVQQDVVIGMTIGQHWVGTITEGRGWTHNCNANKDSYRYLGIGMISHLDAVARHSFERMAAYLTKPDYHIRLVAPAGARLFGRAAYPKNSPAKVMLALQRRRAAAKRKLALGRAKRADKRERTRLEALAGLQALGQRRQASSATFPPPPLRRKYSAQPPRPTPETRIESARPADSEAKPARLWPPLPGVPPLVTWPRETDGR